MSTIFTQHYLIISLNLVQNQEQSHNITRNMILATLLSKVEGKKKKKLMSNSGKISHKQLIHWKHTQKEH